MPYLPAGSHCFPESWLVRFLKDFNPLESSRSVFTKSGRQEPINSVCEKEAR